MVLRNKVIDQTYGKLSFLFETEANTWKINFEEARIIFNRILNDIDVQHLETFMQYHEKINQDPMPDYKPTKLHKENPYF